MTREELRDELLDSVECVVYIPSLGHLNMDEDEKTAFLKDPVAWVLDYLDGTFEEYAEFLEDLDSGFTRCRAITAKGTQCRNQSTESFSDFGVWQERHSAGWIPTCKLHGKQIHYTRLT